MGQKWMYNEKELPFNELLEKDNPASIHAWNLQVLATVMYKISNGLSMPSRKIYFQKNRNPYILRQNSQFTSPQINTVYGTESISNLGLKICNEKDMTQNNLKHH